MMILQANGEIANRDQALLIMSPLRFPWIAVRNYYASGLFHFEMLA